MMRKFFLAIALFFTGVSAHAAFAVVQSTSVNAAGNQAITLNSVAAGNLLVLIAGEISTSNTISAVSDSQGAYTQAAAVVATGVHGGGYIYYLANTNSGTHTATVTAANGGTWGTLTLLEISGASTITPLDIGNGVNRAAGAFTATTDGLAGTAFTTAVTNEYILGYTFPNSTNDTDTAGTGYTLGVDFIGTIANHVYTETKAQATVASVTVTFSPTGASDDRTVLWMAIKPPSTDPTISNINAAPWRNGASITLGGINLKAAGNSTLTMGGISQTITSQSATAPVFTAARGTNKYGTTLNIILTDSNALPSNTYTGMTGLSPQSGWDFTDLTTPNATASYRLTAAGDIASGDQIAFDTKSGLVDVFPDGTFSADPSVTSFTIEVWTSAGGWGSTAVQLINPSSGRAFLHSARANIGTATQLVQWREPAYKGDNTALSDTTSYNVKYGTVSGTHPLSVSVPAPATSTTLTGLVSALPYYYVITTVRSDGTESPESYEGTFTP